MKAREPQDEITSELKLNHLESGLIKGNTRATFIVNRRQLKKIKAIAHWQRISIKDVVSYAFEAIINQYEDASGTISLDYNKSQTLN